MSTAGLENPHVCPRCGGDTCRSHRRNFWEKVFSGLARLFPYRCRSCAHRFFDWR